MADPEMIEPSAIARMARNQWPSKAIAAFFGDVDGGGCGCFAGCGCGGAWCGPQVDREQPPPMTAYIAGVLTGVGLSAWGLRVAYVYRDRP